jgi:hypothetical protein
MMPWILLSRTRFRLSPRVIKLLQLLLSPRLVLSSPSLLLEYVVIVVVVVVVNTVAVLDLWLIVLSKWKKELLLRTTGTPNSHFRSSGRVVLSIDLIVVIVFCCCRCNWKERDILCTKKMNLAMRDQMDKNSTFNNASNDVDSNDVYGDTAVTYAASDDDYDDDDNNVDDDTVDIDHPGAAAAVVEHSGNVLDGDGFTNADDDDPGSDGCRINNNNNRVIVLPTRTCVSLQNNVEMKKGTAHCWEEISDNCTVRKGVRIYIRKILIVVPISKQIALFRLPDPRESRLCCPA